MLPLLSFLLAASTALLKLRGFLKSQMLSQKAFARAQCSEEDCQNYITISRYTSTVISKAKAESWQKTCSSLSPKTCSSKVFSLLHSISGSSSLTPSDHPNFPSCHTPVDCANQLSSHLQSHFLIQTPKPFQSTKKANKKQNCSTLPKDH